MPNVGPAIGPRMSCAGFVTAKDRTDTVVPNLGVTDADARDIASYRYPVGDATRLDPPDLLPVSWFRALPGEH